MVNSQLSAIDAIIEQDDEAHWEFNVQHFKMIFQTIAITPDTGDLSPAMTRYISETMDDKSLQEVREVIACIGREN